MSQGSALVTSCNVAFVVVVVAGGDKPTVDNELGRATGWRPGQLSEQGRAQAQQLGQERWEYPIS